MKCEKCGHDNEAKVIYCVACGAKIIYTKQKVKEEYEKKIREEKIQRGIELTQTLLMWAIIIFFILLAIKTPFTKVIKVYPYPALKVNFYQNPILSDQLDISEANK